MRDAVAGFLASAGQTRGLGSGRMDMGALASGSLQP